MLTRRDLNRTLLRRQHLLEPTDAEPLAMTEHLLGLQGQDNLPPYLALSARLTDFDPQDLSGALERREAVRLLTMRGTIHVLTPDDALTLRTFVQPGLDQQSSSNQNSRPARDVPVPDLLAAVDRVLADGPLPVKALGERLAGELGASFPDVPAAALAHRARERAALVQVPPRGLWRGSGGVVYQTLATWLGRPLVAPDEVDVRELVRRYLRAFGPATAADMTTWSRVTRLGPVFASMAEELVPVECEDGRRRFDVPDASYASGDEPAPVRLLGAFDNLWLSHADRSHVMDQRAWKTWLGPNGGIAHTLFADGFVAGLWRVSDPSPTSAPRRVEVVELFRRLTRAERGELAAETARVEALLAR